MHFLDELEEEVLKELGDDETISVSFTGEAYTGSRGQAAVVTDLLGSMLVAIVVIFLLLAFFFRSIRLGLLSIPPNLIPLVATMAYMVWREIPLNVSTVIIFSISLGLAVNGTIHVLARFREEMQHGLGREAALVRAARGTGRAIVISCITLMAGFSVLLLSSFVPVRNFGELIAITIGGCLVATLIVLPPLLSVAGGTGGVKSSED
jgi:predicted RND superfamily exporter protein